VFDDAVIAEAGRRILAAAPPGSRVILFGSHARGQAGEHSDLDFLVIEPVVEDVVEETYRLRCTLRGLDVFADIVLVSEDEVETWGDVYGTIIHAALGEGRPAVRVRCQVALRRESGGTPGPRPSSEVDRRGDRVGPGHHRAA